jgi:hypothetical protein
VTASDQTRRNRVTAGKKAAATVKARRVQRNDRFGPEGSHRGSTPVEWDFAGVLARLRARQGQGS